MHYEMLSWSWVKNCGIWWRIGVTELKMWTVWVLLDKLVGFVVCSPNHCMLRCKGWGRWMSLGLELPIAEGWVQGMLGLHGPLLDLLPCGICSTGLSLQLYWAVLSGCSCYWYTWGLEIYGSLLRSCIVGFVVQTSCCRRDMEIQSLGW